ncbi:hypothetical protein LG047_02150 [Methylocystis sp. WRRC1]|uniref:hypothetical protein n=1 Tax=unclassified Methylocystis TaxID=2625913 RepID=UPI0001F867B7|nr:MULTISPECIES: hypothetical protein [unclassified Methylocystis]MCC3244133.1 hypothetical protein [Methylocystis sp. WRRC1]
MSLVDKFDDQIEPAFTRSFDRESARRQFRVSILLVAAMATAAFVLGFALPVNSVQKSSPLADNGAFSGRLVSMER